MLRQSIPSQYGAMVPVVGARKMYTAFVCWSIPARVPSATDRRDTAQALCWASDLPAMIGSSPL